MTAAEETCFAVSYPSATRETVYPSIPSEDVRAFEALAFELNYIPAGKRSGRMLTDAGVCRRTLIMQDEQRAWKNASGSGGILPSAVDSGAAAIADALERMRKDFAEYQREQNRQNQQNSLDHAKMEKRIAAVRGFKSSLQLYSARWRPCASNTFKT